MRHLVLTLALCAATVPALAQDADPSADTEEGLSLIQEGAKLLFRGLLSQMEPALQDLAEGMDDFAAQAGPMLKELARLMGDVTNYHPPEVLPNGDIIIRRRSPLEAAPQDEIEI